MISTHLEGYRSRRPLLERSRVTRRIAEAAAYPAVLLIANGAYGKTVALEHYFARENRPRIEVHLDNHTQTLPEFVALFARAIDAQAEPAGRQSVPLECRDSVRNMATFFAERLSEFRGSIVVNNLYLGDADRRITDLVVELFMRTRDRLQWFFVTRGNGHLPIGTWIAYEYADQPINDHVLRFTEQDAIDYAALIRSRLESRECARLVQFTEGWTVATVLAIQTRTRVTDFAKVEADTVALMSSYLFEQVYQNLPEPERRLLLLASVMPDDIDPLVLREIYHDSPEHRLYNLANKVPLVEVVAGKYRIADLFKRFLRQMLYSSDAAATTCRQIAEAFSAIGDSISAMSVYAVAGDWHNALHIVDVNAYSWANTAWPHQLHEIVAAIPKSIISRNPVVLLVQAGLAEQRQTFELAFEFLDQALANSEEPETFLRAAVVATQIRIRNDAPCDPQLLLDALAKAEHDPLMQARAKVLLAALYFRDGRVYEGLALRIDVANFIATTTITMDNAALFYWHAWGFYANGEYGEARSVLNRLVSAEDLWRDCAINARANDLLAKIAFNTTPHLHGIITHNSAAILISEAIQDSAQLMSYLRRRCVYLFYSGDIMLVDLAMNQRDTRTSDLADTYTNIHKFLWHLGNREFKTALYWARFLPPDKVLQDDPFIALSCVALLAVLSKDDEAPSDIEALVANAEFATALNEGQPHVHWASRRHVGIGRYCALLAQTILGNQPPVDVIEQQLDTMVGDPVSDAVREIVRATIAAITSGTQPPDLQDAFEDIRESTYGVIGAILQLAHDYAKTVPAGSLLSKTELEILKELGAGAAAKAIAKQRSASEHTVRTHIKNIFRKLDVRSKVEALNRARQLGILD